MNARIFISKPEDGWLEIKIPEKYKNYSYQALVSVCHYFIADQTYKGLFITENPDPVLYSD